MFGYVNIYKDELKIREFNVFKSYYCGLCKELGKSFNNMVRLGLSYDFTFLALLLDSLECEDAKVENMQCLKHLSNKRPVVVENDAITYSAYISVMMTYYKLLDDIRDDFSIKALFAIIPYLAPIKKAKKKYQDDFLMFRKRLDSLNEKENRNCDCIDEIADDFALLMADIFGKYDSGNDKLRKFGYDIGRYIFIIDALDDLEHDIKHKKYNPIANQYPDEKIGTIVQNVERTIIYTLSSLAKNYEELKINKNKEILDNIIYLGLRNRLQIVADKKGVNNGKSI